MKKFLIALSLILIFTSPVFAVEATRSGKKLERLEQIQARKEEFKTRVDNLKDERKQKLTEWLNQQLIVINDRATQHLQKVLDRLEELLAKIKDRNPEADTAAVQTKIDEAKAAVSAQAEKDYIIEFTDETNLRSGAKAAKNQLHTDLKAVKELVRLARQAVVDTWQTVRAL